MKNYFYTSMLAVLVLGCTPPAKTIGLKIEGGSEGQTTLIGSIEALNADYLVVHDTFQFSATDGEITCTGSSSNGVVKGRTASHNFPISCSDGRKGQVQLQMTSTGRTLRELDSTGIGVGKLSDGSKIKIIVGDLNGTIGW